MLSKESLELIMQLLSGYNVKLVSPTADEDWRKMSLLRDETQLALEVAKTADEVKES